MKTVNNKKKKIHIYDFHFYTSFHNKRNGTQKCLIKNTKLFVIRVTIIYLCNLCLD